MASSDVILLKDEKLRQLSDLIRGHDIDNMYYVNFSSDIEQLKYVRMINDNNNSVVTILDSCKGLINRYKDDPIRAPIANKVHEYAEHCLNFALQFYRNYTIRHEYLAKMTDHLHKIFNVFGELKTCSEAADVADFKQDIEHHNHKIMSYIRVSANSHASEEFSSYIKNIGIGFHELVQSYQVKLGYGGRFADLEEGQKLEVYAAIIEASGRLNVLDDGGRKALRLFKVTTSHFDYADKALWIFTIGYIVIDVFTSKQPLRTARDDVIGLAAYGAGAELGALVGAAVAAELVAAEATVAVAAITMLSGIVTGFIFSAIAGALIGLIFGSGGEDVLPTQGFIVYVAPMPNGRDIANQIA